MTTNEPDPPPLPPLPPKWSDPGYLAREAERQHARETIGPLVVDHGPGGSYVVGTTEPPTDLRDQIAATLERHEVVWVDHDTGWECGCNEHGTLGPLPSILDVYRHQADAVLHVVQAHVAAQVERARAEGAAEAVTKLADWIDDLGQRPGTLTTEHGLRDEGAVGFLRHEAPAIVGYGGDEELRSAVQALRQRSVRSTAGGEQRG